MPEEEKKLNEQGSAAENGAQAENSTYIEAIKEMKANSVSKDQYEKKCDENKQLLDALINGGQIEVAQEEKEKPDINALRSKLFNDRQELSNIEYVQTALDLRDALIDSGEPDPFLPMGHQIVPTEEDVKAAQKVADVYKDCIEYADGDSQLFTQELQRRTLDVRIK